MAYTGAVTKAVVPVAGLGTRFLPATKATPKVMMPVVDKPAIQYVVEEAASAGINDVLLVTGDGQESIADHFNHDDKLEQALRDEEQRGGAGRGAAPRRSSPKSATSGRTQPRGLGHAVLCGAEHVGDEPFAVLLGDDLISADDDLLARMLAGQAEVRRQHHRADGGPGRQRLRLWRAPRSSRPTRPTSSPSPTWSRSRRPARRRPTGSSSAVTSATRRSSACCGRPRPDAAARSS